MEGCRLEEAIKAGLELVGRSRSVLVGSHDPDGYPNIKAMFNMEHDGLTTFFFSTNTSSKRVAQFRHDPRACIYFVDFEQARGLMLTGDMEVREDIETKKRLWHEGFECYYPQGVTDPDYCVLKFSARSGNLYHNLANVTFAVR